jgi:hypothetical protein
MAAGYSATPLWKKLGAKGGVKLDEDWSGLRLVWRRERRHTSGATPG